ncbi:MAG: glycosyltransferase, partial [Candidatus Woesearchaeota archaeon]
ELEFIQQKLEPLINKLESRLNTEKANLETATQEKPGEHTKHHISNQDKKRILMLTHEFRTRFAGGVQTVVQNLTKNLIKQKFTVDVVERSIQQPHTGKFFYYLDSGRHPTYSFSDMSDFLNTFPYLTLGLLHLQSINFAAGKKGWNNGGLDELKNIYKDIPVVCTVHSMVRYERTLYQEDWQPHAIECQDETIKESDHFIVLHEFGKRKLQEYHRIPDEKISIIPNGIEMHSRFVQKLSEVKQQAKRTFNQEKVLLYVGRISREKGILELIHALALIRKTHNARLVIVGPYQPGHDHFHSEVARRVRDNGLEEHIIFTGKMPPSEQYSKVYSYYEPDVAILPSHHESFPMFALEAISHAVPLVVSDVDGPRHIYSPFRQNRSPDNERNATEHIENSPPGITQPLAVACDPKAPETIEQAVCWIFDNPQKVHTILKNAMQEIHDKYTWDKIAQETGKLYNDVLQGRSHVSPYTVGHLEEKLVEISKKELSLKKGTNIGIIGHFKFKNGQMPDFVAEFLTEMNKFLEHEKINTHGLAMIGDPQQLKYVRVDTYYPPALERAIMQAEFSTLIVFLDYKLSLKAIEAAREKGIKVILFVPYWGLHQELLQFVSQADFVFVFTKEMARKIQSKTGQEVMPIPFVIDSDMVPQPKEHTEFRIAYVGSINNAKKIHRCIEQFYRYLVPKKNLIAGHVELRFYIKETAQDDAAMRALMQEKKKHDHKELVKIFRGQMTLQQELDLIASSDVIIFPSSFEELGELILKALYCKVPIVFPFSEEFYLSIPLAYQFKEYPFTCGYNIDTNRDYSADMGNVNGRGAPIDWECFFNKIIEAATSSNLSSLLHKYHDYVVKNYSWEMFKNTLLPALEYLQGRGNKPKEVDLSTRYVQPKSVLQVLNGKLTIDTKKELEFVRSRISIASLYALWDHFNLDHSESIRRFELAKELAKLGYKVDLIESKPFNLTEYGVPSNLQCVSFNQADYYSYTILLTTSVGGLQILSRLSLEKHPFIIANLTNTFNTPANNEPFWAQDVAHKHARLVNVFTPLHKETWLQYYGRQEESRIFVTDIAAPNEISFRGKDPYNTQDKDKQKIIFLGALPIQRTMMIEKLKAIVKGVCDGNNVVLYIVSNNYNELQKEGIFNEEIQSGKLVLREPVKGSEQYDYYAYADVAVNTGLGKRKSIVSGKLLYYLRAGIPVVSEDDYSNSDLVKDDFNGYNVPFHETDMSAFNQALRKALTKSKQKKWDRKAIQKEIIENHTYRQRALTWDKKILEALGFRISEELLSAR